MSELRHKYNKNRGFIPIINDEEFVNDDGDFDLDNIEINNADCMNQKKNE